MVAVPAKKGLFQLIEVFDKNGNVGVAAPGENIRIKCTIVNLTKRPLMVAEDYITPQYGSMIVRGDAADSFPEAKIPAIAPVDGVMLTAGVDMPKGWMDWGHIRRWIHIAASHDLECGCCVRHRQYTRWLDLQLPDQDWRTIALDLTQSTPTIFLGPEEHDYLKSELTLTIKRRTSEPAGADQPATQPADKVPPKDQPSTPTSKDSPR